MKRIKILIITLLVILLIPIGINYYVIFTSSKYIHTEKDIDKKYDFALVLGCSVLKNGEPSKMLKDRLDRAISLYKNDKIDKIIITGTHRIGYSEVDTMYNYLITSNIPSEDIIRDDNGNSTSESLINYEKNYKDQSVIIITQNYHLYRALYIANRLNLNARGVYAKKVNYNGTLFREAREILARNKDFFKILFVNNW